jgi:predicted ATP-binding protein involved in virulence
LVLIDEPELHLDPSWHRTILSVLAELSPDTQFIVATHSDEIYDSVLSYERHFLASNEDARSKLWPHRDGNGAPHSTPAGAAAAEGPSK